MLGAPKERAVLEMLALRAGRPVPAEALCEGLWGEMGPPSAAKALQTYVSHLRRLFPPGCLLTTSGGYVLALSPRSVDAARFEEAVHQAGQRQEAGDLVSAMALLQEALRLWRGRACPELTEHTWATAEVARLEELRREAQEELAELRLATGEHARLVGELEAAVAAEPLRERRWAQLMLAYYRCGRQADALRAFARLRSTLAEELGISPSAELVALEQKVLLQSAELRPLRSHVGGAPGAQAGGLPRPASSFIGRAGEVAEVAKLLGESRLVTLAGAGGCGKTRLAQEVAAAMADSLAGGAHFVSLAPLTEPGLVPMAVAEALGVQPQSGRAPAQVVTEVIGHRETLAVVDNCEHLVGTVAELVEGLLSGAPGLRVLATSREPLRIAGETVWRVPSLEVPGPGASAAESRGCAAVELFVDRALSARPGLRLDDGATATIAEIARRLDGLPLAIELAAARVAVLDLAGILEGLSDRFALLAGGSRTAPARQQTLRAAVAWSYDLLSAREKELFGRLTVFPASFSLEAAQAVAGSGRQEATEDLFALVSKSMVATVGPEGRPVRYSLHETLRQFGAGQLDEPTAEQARAGHARHYLALVGLGRPEPFGAELAPWLKRVELELDNLRAVFSYLAARSERHAELLGALVALRRYWFIYNHHREGFELLEQALAATSPGEDPVLRARALVTSAHIAAHFDAETSARYAKAGGELAETVGDKATACLAAVVVAIVNGIAGQRNEAEGERALRLARDVGDPLLVCEGLFALALSTPFAGPDATRCREAFEELLATAEENGDLGFSFAAHGNMCLFGFSEGDAKAARPHVEREMELESELGLQSHWAESRFGELLYFEGDYRRALVLHRKAFEQARRQDLPWSMADAAVDAATCLIALGSDDIAAARLSGFAQHELQRAGFGDRVPMDANLEALGARLATRLADVLAEGAAMTREEIGELLTTLEEASGSNSHDGAASVVDH